MSLQHGILLHQQGKLEQAERCYREYLSSEPNDDYAHSRLALCLLEQDGRKRDALEEIDRAISLDPESDYYHAVRSIILSNLNKGREALIAADTAVAINPEATFNYTAKASALSDLMRWADAEEQCRKALTLDSDNDFAKNLLANALRNQGKLEASEFAVDQLLAADPESAFAHNNAGWDALRREDIPKAEEHFRESLRLDPDFEAAREGLLQSFKARSWFYRAYLRYTFFMARFTSGKQWLIIVGAIVIIQVVLRLVGPKIGFLILGAYLLLASFTWLASGIGNFLVWLDRTARLALQPSEKRQGIAICSLLFLGAATVVASFTVLPGTYVFIGLSLLLATVPASLTFDNPSTRGRLVFGSILALSLISTIAGVFILQTSGEAAAEVPLDQDNGILFAAIPFFCFAACTWMGNITSLRDDDSE